MKTDCEKISEEILSTDLEFSSEIKSHIEQCEVCSNLASEWLILKDSTDIEDCKVPTELDFKIVGYAKSSLKQKRISKLFYKIISYSSSAACAIFAFWMCFFPLSQKTVSIEVNTIGEIYSNTASEIIQEQSFDEVATRAIYEILDGEISTKEVSIPSWNCDKITNGLMKLKTEITNDIEPVYISLETDENINNNLVLELPKIQ